MSGQIENLITRYEEDIKLHDCQQWERQLEEDPTLDINDATRKKTRRKMELLDVDLVRGSTFPKSKTRHDLSSILCYSVLSVILISQFMPELKISWRMRNITRNCQNFRIKFGPKEMALSMAIRGRLTNVRS